MTTVFLSYVRADDGEPYDRAMSFVARLHADLTKAGFDVWFDRVSMPSRQITFHQEIADAIRARDRLVLVVGPKAAHSDYVGRNGAGRSNSTNPSFPSSDVATIGSFLSRIGGFDPRAIFT